MPGTKKSVGEPDRLPLRDTLALILGERAALVIAADVAVAPPLMDGETLLEVEALVAGEEVGAPVPVMAKKWQWPAWRQRACYSQTLLVLGVLEVVSVALTEAEAHMVENGLTDTVLEVLLLPVKDCMVVLVVLGQTVAEAQAEMKDVREGATLTVAVGEVEAETHIVEIKVLPTGASEAVLNEMPGARWRCSR